MCPHVPNRDLGVYVCPHGSNRGLGIPEDFGFRGSEKKKIKTSIAQNERVGSISRCLTSTE